MGIGEEERSEIPVSKGHDYFMRAALREAEKALDLGEVPIGCVIVQNDTVIARGHNLTEQLKDATAHAEMMAITSAEAHLDSRYLTDCTLYVTIEPCPMCAGAIVLSRIRTLVFGAYDIKAGACGTLYTITEDKRLNHQVHTVGGVLDAECASLVQHYFRELRSPASGSPKKEPGI
jgi:tRNA(adenine34) deaminase